jgi:peptidase M23-like protein
MKRLVALLPVLVALQVGAPPALAWTWPVDGPVLRPFVLGDDPYAAGQHRGIDVGAPSGGSVRAPAAGTVTFAGTVPGGGRAVTVQTADGYSVTLLHLGSLAVRRGGAVAEGDAVGTVGPSGEPELTQPHVHLGVRRSADPHGYLDPLGFLPARTVEPPPEPEKPAGDPAPEEPVEATPPIQPPVAEQGPEPAEDRSREGSAAEQGAEADHSLVSASARRGRRPAGAPRTTSARRAASISLTRVRAGTPARAGRATLALPPRTRLASFEPHVEPAEEARTRAEPLGAEARKRVAAGAAGKAGAGGAGLAALLALAAGAWLVVRRGRLRDAAPADRPTSVLLHRAGLAAEDACPPRPAEQDGLVFDRDLERVLLGEAEPLADLDRDDDPSELVDVADDPRPLHFLGRAHPCAHRNRSRRPLPLRASRSRSHLTPNRSFATRFRPPSISRRRARSAARPSV